MRRYPTTGPASYLYQRSPGHRHRGVDIAAPEGTPVTSPAAASVVHVAEPGTPGFRGYGRVVVLESLEGPRVWVLLAHLGPVDVVPGQRLERGERIGQVGRTGVKQSATHLHLEVADHPYPMASEAQRLDPVAWLNTHGPVLGGGRLSPAPAPPAPPPRVSRSGPRSPRRVPAAAIIAGGAALVAVLVALTRR